MHDTAGVKTEKGKRKRLELGSWRVTPKTEQEINVGERN